MKLLNMRYKLKSIMLYFLLALSLGACATIEGAGEDIESAGEAVQDAADG